MKHYKDYMDNISADPDLYEDLKDKLGGTKSKRRLLLPLGAVAAGVATFALFIWLVPQLLAGPNGVAPGLPGGSSAANTLTLNQVHTQADASLRISGHFWHALTDEQKAAVLPGLPFPCSATAHYQGDGSLVYVSAFELDDDGAVSLHEGLYMRTEIMVSPGTITEDVVYEYDPVTSVIGGVSVIAGVFDFTEYDGVALYMASFEMDGVAYHVRLHDDDTSQEAGLARLTELVTGLTENAADLSVLADPEIPEVRDEQLTLEQAQADPDFGAYLPGDVPSKFAFESAMRLTNQDRDSLFVYWYAGQEYLQWTVSAATDYDRARMVSPDEREKYDLSLYPIPRADSIPAELREYVDHPVFRAEELTLDLITARAYRVDEQGDSSGWRMDFNVLYGEVVVRITGKGISAEEAWALFTALADRLA